MSLNQLVADVRAIHLAMGSPAPTSPVRQPDDAVSRRVNWLDEETDELLCATTIVDQANAYIDLIYFAVGGLVELGIQDTDALWDIIQAANMAKRQPEGLQAPEPLLAVEVDR